MLGTYIIASLALIVKPGPDLLCLIATALSAGKARAATLMIGLILGCWTWILLLSLGVASFFTGHKEVLAAIQAVGVVYISYLAVASFREARSTWRATDAPDLVSQSAKGWRLVLRGVAMAMSNPLTILFFLAFLPTFTSHTPNLPPALATLCLGTLFCALVPFVDIPLILAADFFRARLARSCKALASLKYFSAGLLAIVAIILASGLCL